MKRLYLLFFSVCFCASLLAQNNNQPITSQADLVSALSNFPADSAVRNIADSNFAGLSANRLIVTQMFNRLFAQDDLTEEMIKRINVKAVAIIVDGDESLVSQYIRSNPNIDFSREDEIIIQPNKIEND